MKDAKTVRDIANGLRMFIDEPSLSDWNKIRQAIEDAYQLGYDCGFQDGGKAPITSSLDEALNTGTGIYKP